MQRVGKQPTLCRTNQHAPLHHTNGYGQLFPHLCLWSGFYLRLCTISPQEVTYLCPCVCSSKYRSCLCSVHEAFVFLCHYAQAHRGACLVYRIRHTAVSPSVWLRLYVPALAPSGP